jgi:hypothetical protein
MMASMNLLLDGHGCVLQGVQLARTGTLNHLQETVVEHGWQLRRFCSTQERTFSIPKMLIELNLWMR